MTARGYFIGAAALLALAGYISPPRWLDSNRAERERCAHQMTRAVPNGRTRPDPVCEARRDRGLVAFPMALAAFGMMLFGGASLRDPREAYL